MHAKPPYPPHKPLWESQSPAWSAAAENITVEKKGEKKSNSTFYHLIIKWAFWHTPSRVVQGRTGFDDINKNRIARACCWTVDDATWQNVVVSKLQRWLCPKRGEKGTKGNSLLNTLPSNSSITLPLDQKKKPIEYAEIVMKKLIFLRINFEMFSINQASNSPYPRPPSWTEHSSPTRSVW